MILELYIQNHKKFITNVLCTIFYELGSISVGLSTRGPRIIRKELIGK